MDWLFMRLMSQRKIKNHFFGERMLLYQKKQLIKQRLFVIEKEL
jgi:hypothetical protein